tara:strand:+ start:845 stop:1183 length:339 start_codon:yes stop_codon:yes gene_type:complete
MKSLLSALVLTAASAFPVSAAIHDFNPTNAAPRPSQERTRPGFGRCLTTRDQSEVCFIKTSNTNYSIAIKDVDYPGVLEVSAIDCSTGRWNSYGGLPKATLDLYLDDFCTTF